MTTYSNKEKISNENIERNIFQTYKENDLESCPDFMRECANSWIEKNKNYRYIYISDNDAQKFIYDKYGKENFELFMNVGNKIMQADIIRLVYIYEFGGVYADMDTVCNESIDSWIDDDYDFLIAPESNHNFVQWFFISKSKNPILKNTIDEIFINLKNNRYLGLPHAVVGITGPFAFTRNILNFYGITDRMDIRDLPSSSLSNELVKTKIYRYGYFGGNATDEKDKDKYLTHIFGSLTWNHEYDQWILDKTLGDHFGDLDFEESFWNNWRWFS